MAKQITILYFVLQCRRNQKIKRGPAPDGQWHDRQSFATESLAINRLAELRKAPGAYLFDWKISIRENRIMVGTDKDLAAQVQV